MKNIKPFGPSIGKSKLSNNIIKRINNEFDLKTNLKFRDYSSKLASQIKNEVKLGKLFIERYLSKEIKMNIKKFLKNEKNNNIKEIKILNLWVIRQFKNEYNPIHFHNGDLSGVGYVKLPKGMIKNELLKTKKSKQTEQLIL